MITPWSHGTWPTIHLSLFYGKYCEAVNKNTGFRAKFSCSSPDCTTSSAFSGKSLTIPCACFLICKRVVIITRLDLIQHLFFPHLHISDIWVYFKFTLKRCLIGIVVVINYGHICRIFIRIKKYASTYKAPFHICTIVKL